MWVGVASMCLRCPATLKPLSCPDKEWYRRSTEIALWPRRRFQLVPLIARRWVGSQNQWQFIIISEPSGEIHYLFTFPKNKCSDNKKFFVDARIHLLGPWKHKFEVYPSYNWMRESSVVNSYFGSTTVGRIYDRNLL